jgi:hypothetical protein
MAEHGFGPDDEVKDGAKRRRRAARRSLVLEFADRTEQQFHHEGRWGGLFES